MPTYLNAVQNYQFKDAFVFEIINLMSGINVELSLVIIMADMVSSNYSEIYF